MASDVTRRNFVQGSAAVGGGIALGGPIPGAGRAKRGRGTVRRTVGYGRAAADARGGLPVRPSSSSRGGSATGHLPRLRRHERRQPDAGHLRRDRQLPRSRTAPRS